MKQLTNVPKSGSLCCRLVLADAITTLCANDGDSLKNLSFELWEEYAKCMYIIRDTLLEKDAPKLILPLVDVSRAEKDRNDEKCTKNICPENRRVPSKNEKLAKSPEFNKEFADVMVYFRFFQAMTYVPRKPMTVLDKKHFISFQ